MDAMKAATGGTTINDGLRVHFGATASESVADAELRWLKEQGAAGTTVPDLWKNFLSDNGHPTLLAYWNSLT